MADTQKRTIDAVEDSNNVKAVLFSVEGTAVPTSFWQDRLAVYVRENLKLYLEEQWSNAECTEFVTALREQATKDKADEVDGVVEIPVEEETDESKALLVEAVVNNILWQMNTNRENDLLQKVKSRVWRDGFNNKKVQGQVYADVSAALKHWKSEEKKVYTFSECADAQKLIFGHSDQGDLTEYLTGHFDDKTTGSETEKDSYSKIAELIDLKPEEVLFVTAKPNFAKEAASAGFKTSVVQRSDDSVTADGDAKDYTIVSSFTDLTSTEEAEPTTKKATTEEVSSNGDTPAADTEHKNGADAATEEPETTPSAE